jgi:hypothetical protein
MRLLPGFAICLLVAMAVAVPLVAQTSSFEYHERPLDHESGGATLFLFGAFCALWAQNTGRNAWLWFFLGLLFSVITVLFLLSKNSGDRARAMAMSPASSA